MALVPEVSYRECRVVRSIPAINKDQRRRHSIRVLPQQIVKLASSPPLEASSSLIFFRAVPY